MSIQYEAHPLRHTSGRYDIIHCHFGMNGNRAMTLRDIGILEGKLVTTFHAVDLTVHPQRYGKDIYQKLFHAGDLFLPISERWKQRLLELGCNEKKIIVHRMGIDCNKFTFSPRTLEPGGCFKLVSVARFVEKKGIEYAIRSVAKLKHAYANLEYTIIGDGPLKANLQALVRQAGLGDIVHIVGWREQKDVIEILKQAHVLLAPSVTDEQGDQEGIPVVLMEAMAMGMPILSTVHSGIPELVEDGRSGYLVPERDVDALLQKLNRLIDNPTKWKEMGLHGRRFVEKSFEISTLNDSLVQLYQDLVNNGS